ncbi:MAG: RidA family protein [Desulfobacterales bacterium]|nr:MAG: RidA family protein [Desulfobacterales bacterium]
MKKIILQPSTLGVPIAPYVPGTKRNAFVFTSGQVALDKEGNLVGKGDVGAQTRQVLQNIKAVLQEGGATLDDVMKTTVFLADIKDFSAMNEVYADFFGDAKPARSTVQAALARPEFLVEIEAIAIVGDE